MEWDIIKNTDCDHTKILATCGSACYREVWLIKKLTSQRRAYCNKLV